MLSASSGRSGRRSIRLILLFLFLLACGLPNLDIGSAPSPQLPNHIIVSITDPVDGEVYPINAGLEIRAEAVSDNSITHMELWADGILYEDYSAPEDGLGLLVHYWSWSPQTIGVHTLMVRAHNDQGQTAFSNVIGLKGIEDPGFVLIASAEEGDSASVIAEKYSASVDQILLDNPELSDGASLAAGEEIFVYVGAPQTGSISAMAANISMRVNEWFANGQSGLFQAQAAPSAPTLEISGQGCSAILSISDHSTNEKGFQIYRLNPGSLSFSNIETLPAHDGPDAMIRADPNLFGLYHYYVSAFDDLGEEGSNLVSLNIAAANCAGTPTTIDDLASIPAGVDQYYLYVSINNGNWRRFPAQDFSYLKKSEGIEFGQVVSTLAPNLVGDISMRGEVWGMVNGAAILLGTFEKSFKAAQAPAAFDASAVHNSMQTVLEVRGTFDVSAGKDSWHKNWGMQYDTHVFRFGTDTKAAYGIWQVSSIPFDAEASFNPVCLLLAGKANGSGAPDSPFKFNIDFSSLKPKIESVQLSPFENSLSQTPVFAEPFSPEKLDAAGQQMVTQPKWGAGAFGLGGGNPVFTNFDPCAQNVSAEGVVTYHVRIIPMSNGQSAGKPSNTVTMIYDPNGDLKITFPASPVLPNQVFYDVEILDFTGVQVPNLEYEYCVEIVENPLFGLGTPWSDLQPGNKVCPKKFTGGSKNELLGAIEDAFNFITGLYNKLSDWATELVEKLNPLCIQAKLASSAIKVGEEEVKDACHYIAVIAVTAAKTYVGLPPSLPNFDQLTELGKENLVELAAQELESSGVPCPEDCKDVIRKGIDYSIEQVKQSMSNSSCMGEKEAHDNGIEPLCLPAGIITKPDPRGQPAPAIVEVQVTRRAGTTGLNFPEPKSCNVSINIVAQNNVVDSYTSNAGFHFSGGALQGNLLNGTGTFPNLQPEKSTKTPIILSPDSFWLPGHQQFVQNGWKPEYYDDWYILYQGAMATINADGACKFEFPEGTGITDVSIQGNSMQVGPLGGAWKQTCHPYNCP